MPEDLRMLLDSFAPFSGSRRVKSESAIGIPARAINIPHRQLCPMVTTSPNTRMPMVLDRGSDRLCQLKTRPRASVG